MVNTGIEPWIWLMNFSSYDSYKLLSRVDRMFYDLFNIIFLTIVNIVKSVLLNNALRVYVVNDKESKQEYWYVQVYVL